MVIALLFLLRDACLLPPMSNADIAADAADGAPCRCRSWCRISDLGSRILWWREAAGSMKGSKMAGF